MISRTSNSRSDSGPLWRALALALIAIAVGFFGRTSGLETLVYDYFQRYQYKAASDQILLLTTDSRADGQNQVWDDTGFRAVTRKLSLFGARLIVATEPLDLPDVPSEEQVQALIELQQQAQRSTVSTGDLKLTSQLSVFQDRYDQRMALIRQLQLSRNVILTAYSSGFGNNSNITGDCGMHSVNLAGTDDSSLKDVRYLRYVSTPSADICESSTAVGISNFWPDEDGIVRSADLIINANGTYLPSLALATAAAVDGDNHDIVIASPVSLTLSQKIAHTDEGFRILNRYYNGPDNQPAFQTITANELLAGKVDPRKIRNRIVLIGESAESAATFIPTPVNSRMPPLEAVATSLSNILEQDYLLRPDILAIIEIGVLGAIAVIALLWLPAMPFIAALLVSLVFATMIVSLEAWFLLTESIWVQLATPAIFAFIAVWTVQLWPRSHKASPAEAARGMRTRRGTRAHKVGEHSQLDLEFSVLRQQTPTEETKEKMYDIAMIHGRAKEYARAEAVLQHIAKIDPGYRDVSQLLQKLSGAKKKKARKARHGAASLPADRRRLGRYEIDRVLGRGAMATVYLGRDPAINRKVAIKTVALAREFDAAELEDARLQFQREAESAGRLNHPNIIAIYDVGTDDDVSYLAMEYFEGASLLEHTAADNLLPAKWVLELVARAAEALDYAHRQNVVHRDIKPANLMYHAASDTLKLTDFGIARLTDSSRTKTGVILGTPSYMSPEQLSAAGVTGQSDLYSLGITMYQLLTGTAPFRADSIPKLMDKILNEPHRPASDLRNDLPPCVDEILAKCMAKDPEDRFQHGREMAMELRACAKSFKRQP
jgi:serine/threonine-protein kinase